MYDVVKKTVRLHWTHGSTNGRPILYYIISARTNWDAEWHNITQSKIFIIFLFFLCFKIRLIIKIFIVYI